MHYFYNKISFLYLLFQKCYFVFPFIDWQLPSLVLRKIVKAEVLRVLFKVTFPNTVNK